MGACPICDGIGTENHFDGNLIVPDDSLSLAEGAIAPWHGNQTDWYDQTLAALARHCGDTTSTPWASLKAETRDLIINGSKDPVAIPYRDGSKVHTVTKPFEGVLKNLRRRLAQTDSMWVREALSRYQSEKPCHACHGARLKPEALCVKVNELDISQASDLPLRQAPSWFSGVEARSEERRVW